MAQPMTDSTLLDLERHRLLLETQVAQLRKALQTWQLWSAEYEGLKEEIQAHPSPTADDLLSIGREFHGQVVTLVEIDDILNLKAEPRSAEQVVGLLERRIDYVSQNVKTAEKQLQAAEEKLEKVDMVKEDLEEGAKDEEGLPLTEILEELDEEGNVVSWKTSTPGSEKGQLLDVLRRAGVTDLDGQPQGGETSKTAEGEIEQTDVETKPLPTPEEPSTREVLDITVEDTITTPSAAKSIKKGVSFTDDTKPGPDTHQSATAARIEAIMTLAQTQNAPLPSTGADAPIIPASESADDAALRSDMLQYGMSEIGSVVAELELESGSDYSDDDEGYDDEFSEGDDDEDRFGRSTRAVVDEGLHQRMRELEEKLGVRMMTNAGPKAPADISVEESEAPEAGIAQIKITQEDVDRAALLQNPSEPEPAPASKSQSGKPKTEKKGVRFAADLDISPPPEAPKPAAPPVRSKPATASAPISDVVERVSTASRTPAAPAPTKRPSKFKAARAAPPPFLPPQPTFQAPRSERTVPTGPANATLAGSVVEREVEASAEVREPDELDAGLLQQEVAAEYHRVRNRMIQREGGFAERREEVDAEGTILEEEREVGGRRVSRFMAARLARG